MKPNLSVLLATLFLICLLSVAAAVPLASLNGLEDSEQDPHDSKETDVSNSNENKDYHFGARHGRHSPPSRRSHNAIERTSGDLRHIPQELYRPSLRILERPSVTHQLLYRPKLSRALDGFESSFDIYKHKLSPIGETSMPNNRAKLTVVEGRSNHQALKPAESHSIEDNDQVKDIPEQKTFSGVKDEHTFDLTNTVITPNLVEDIQTADLGEDVETSNSGEDIDNPNLVEDVQTLNLVEGDQTPNPTTETVTAPQKNSGFGPMDTDISQQNSPCQQKRNQDLMNLSPLNPLYSVNPRVPLGPVYPESEVNPLYSLSSGFSLNPWNIFNPGRFVNPIYYRRPLFPLYSGNALWPKGTGSTNEQPGGARCPYASNSAASFNSNPPKNEGFQASSPEVPDRSLEYGKPELLSSYVRFE